jgi:hypothetical protein
MTNLETVHSTGSAQSPAVGVRDCLAQILDTAQQLYVDAQWLQANTGGVLSDLQGIANDPAVPGDNIAAALDAASWLHRAAENMEEEFGALIDCLDDAVESLSTNTN